MPGGQKGLVFGAMVPSPKPVSTANSKVVGDLNGSFCLQLGLRTSATGPANSHALVSAVLGDYRCPGMAPLWPQTDTISRGRPPDEHSPSQRHLPDKACHDV